MEIIPLYTAHTPQLLHCDLWATLAFWECSRGSQQMHWLCMSVSCAVPPSALWLFCHWGERCHLVLFAWRESQCASSTEKSSTSGAESCPQWCCAPFPCISRYSWPIRVGDQICLEHVESFHIAKLAWKWELAVAVIYYHLTEGWLPVRFVSRVFFHRHVCPYCKIHHPKWHQLCLPRGSWISPRDSLICQKPEPSHARKTAGRGNCAF